MKTDAPYKACHQCTRYMISRRAALAPAMAEVVIETGESPREVADRFMAGVHARHLEGLPIMPEEVAR